MARHQIIYTSCMRGIDGVNDGQQVYSYDVSFTGSINDEVKSLFTYQVPSLPSGVVMTEEIAKTMPSAFLYKYLKDKRTAITLNTYLGRDYMGSAGRFGNHLSHSVICDSYEMDTYPCEYYGSRILRNSMDYNEVNNSNMPEYLKTPDLLTGPIVDADRVISFLGLEDNLSQYKKMVYAMLKFPIEKKRVIINDLPENIIMWISALHYTLPLEMAKKVNITTYEYDPELSPAQICGVTAEGSRYGCEAYLSSGRHYVFDFPENRYSDVEISGPLFDFLDTAFSFSYDSLTDFHKFLMSDCYYRDVSEDYYRAYGLYSFLMDGMAGVSREDFEGLAGFADQYCSHNMKRRIVAELIKNPEFIKQSDHAYALSIIGYMRASMDVLDEENCQAVRQLIVARVIFCLSDGGVSEQEFMKQYGEIVNLTGTLQFSLPAGLMADSNHNVLLDMIKHGSNSWIIYFIIKIISDYVMDRKLPAEELYPDRAIGELYAGAVKVSYGLGGKNGFEVIEKILDTFKSSGMYLVNMTLNVEGFLHDLNLGGMDLNHLWEYFIKIAIEMPSEEVKGINGAFAEYERYEEMFAVYTARIRHAKDLYKARDIFYDMRDYWFHTCHRCAGQYSDKVVGVYGRAYMDRIGSLPGPDQFHFAKELLQTAMDLKLEEDYVDDLMKAAAEFIPLEKPKRDNGALLKKMMEYQSGVRHKKVTGRLLLFCIGMGFDRLKGAEKVEQTVEEINCYSGGESVKIKSSDDKWFAEYFDWILTDLMEYNIKSEGYAAVFGLFVMPEKLERQFMENCCRKCYKKCKETGYHEAFSEFLSFMFTHGNRDDIENTGKYLCKLSKQKLEELDEELSSYFSSEKKASRAWNEVRAVAERTNPLLNNLSGLIKRIRD